MSATRPVKCFYHLLLNNSSLETVMLIVHIGHTGVHTHRVYRVLTEYVVFIYLTTRKHAGL